LLFLHCKTCAIVIGLLKATYLLTYLLTKWLADHPPCFSLCHEGGRHAKRRMMSRPPEPVTVSEKYPILSNRMTWCTAESHLSCRVRQHSQTVSYLDASTYI